jgi:acyl-coenzyme A synthetase/AMP-(fatty) acid ligase
VLYTSGSTGQPKGVMIEQRSLTNYLSWVTDHLLSESVHYLPVVTRLSFDAALKQLFAPLFSGKAVWFLPQDVIADPERLLHALRSKSKVGLNCVPSLWKELLHLLQDAPASMEKGILTDLFVGGEALSSTLVQESLEVIPDLHIHNLYGPTEATANTSCARVLSAEDILIGYPLANTRVYVLDQQMQPVPLGVPGELYIGGMGLARGYLQQPALTAERFVPDPWSGQPGARLYRSGDRVRYRADGQLEYLGRMDRQVKLRGYRIELGEIEAALLEHEGLAAAAVLALPMPSAEQHLVGYLQWKPEGAHAIEQVRQMLNKRLPAYMIPSQWVELEALPLLPNGKLDRLALPAPESLTSEQEKKISYVAPQTPQQEMLVAIWKDVLGRDLVGIQNNFFELGGHSLLATRVISQIRRLLHIELPIRILFEHPTIMALSEAMSRFKDDEANLRRPAIVPIDRSAYNVVSVSKKSNKLV